MKDSKEIDDFLVIFIHLFVLVTVSIKDSPKKEIIRQIKIRKQKARTAVYLEWSLETETETEKDTHTKSGREKES